MSIVLNEIQMEIKYLFLIFLSLSPAIIYILVFNSHLPSLCLLKSASENAVHRLESLYQQYLFFAHLQLPVIYSVSSGRCATAIDVYISQYL